MGLLYNPAKRDDHGWHRVVFGEVIIPDVPNVYGDFHSRESVRQFAYGFMLNGFRFDLDHDNADVSNEVKVVESFIARDNDPDFIGGSWVMGIQILSDDIWGKVLSGELNGFSYDALFRRGMTQPSLEDGHQHAYYLVLDDEGRPIVGSTSVNDEHYHGIVRHTITEPYSGHQHIYQIV
jgi:hypothetical protein